MVRKRIIKTPENGRPNKRRRGGRCNSDKSLKEKNLLDKTKNQPEEKKNHNNCRFQRQEFHKMEDFRDPALQPERTSSELISSSTTTTGCLCTKSQSFHSPSLPSSAGTRSTMVPAPTQLSTWQLQPRATPFLSTPQLTEAQINPFLPNPFQPPPQAQNKRYYNKTNRRSHGRSQRRN
jgi:hypothetical protein